MYVVAYCPETNEEYLRRELSDEEIMDERKFADEIANMYGVEIDESDGYIYSFSGDLRVEFRENPDNDIVIWSGRNFFFKTGE